MVSLEGLPDELLVMIAAYLDAPSRVGLSLLSSSFRLKFWDFRKGEFNNWTFMDECARKGYVDLIKYAVKNGARVDLTLLQVAIEANNTELTKFICDFMDEKEYLQFSFQTLAASKGNERLVDFFQIGERTGHIRNRLIEFAAEGGHYDLTMELYSGVKMLKLEKPLCFYFAKGGHLDLAIKISETNPSVEDMNEILMAGCIGGHKDVILYALENGARPNIFWDVSLVGPSLGSPALFDLLLEHFPDYLSNEINRIKVLSFKYPCVPLVKWLIGKGIAFSDLDVHRLFAANYFGLDLPSEALMKVMEETKENRFECMKYLSENAGKTWETGFLFEMARWASLKEMSWVFHRCTDISPKGAPYRFPVGVMDRFLSSRNRVDLGLLEFLLFKVGCPIAGVDLFLICFADNNLEALHFLDDNYFSKKENLPMGKADELKRLTPEKSRIRMGNMLQVIRWFCFHKVPLAKAVIGTLKTVINLYFQRELEKILSEYWELVVL